MTEDHARTVLRALRSPERVDHVRLLPCEQDAGLDIYEIELDGVYTADELEALAIAARCGWPLPDLA